MARGTAEFDTVKTASYSARLKFLILIFLSGLFWTMALLMSGNSHDPRGASVTGWVMAGLALLLTLLVILRLVARIAAFSSGLFRQTTPVLVDIDGVHQTSARGQEVDLKWEDIRLIQHRRAAHLVRGRDKKQTIEISTRLQNHETVSAFLKFSFLLRQETGSEWRGLLTEVRSRLEGPGFHFHYDGDRTDTVYINAFGIRHSSVDGIESEMTWDLMRESKLDKQKDRLRFSHTGSRTSISIPRGTDSDKVIEEFIRWALHTAPGFSGTDT